MVLLDLLLSAVLAAVLLVNGCRVVNEHETGIVFRLGRNVGTRTSGPRWIVAFIDRLVVVDMRSITRDVPPQDVLTKDNVSIKVTAVLCFRVVRAEHAVIQVENGLHAMTRRAQATLRSVLRQHESDELPASREKVNRTLRNVIDAQTEARGSKVSNVEVKTVDVPIEMQRALARQAGAERERRAKVSAAERKYQTAAKPSRAAERTSPSPRALQLRYLQALSKGAEENNPTTIVPLPMALIRPFIQAGKNA